MSVYLRILGYVKPYLGLFALAVAAMTIFAALDAFSITLLIPFLNALFQHVQPGAAAQVDVIGGDTPVHRLLQWAVAGALAHDSPMAAVRSVVVLMFGVFLVKNVFLYVKMYTISVMDQRVTRDMRNEVYDHLLRLGLPFFDRTRAGQVISRMTGDVDQMRMLVTQNLAKALSSAIQVLVFLALLIALNWKLALITCLCLPAMLGLWRRFRKRLHTGVLRVLNAVGELASHIQERVSGIRLVKSSAAEEWESRKFRELTRAHYKAVIRNERWRQFFQPATEMITATALLLLLLYGSRLVLVEQAMSPSDFMVFIVTAMKLMSPVKWLGNLPALMRPGLAGAERAFELLDTPPEVEDDARDLPVAGFRDALRFEGVDFEYNAGEPVLRGIDLAIRPGEVVALVGPSGSGKSTLAALVPRFYEPMAGRITLDGQDLRAFRLDDLRRLMGIVSQETVLFHDTVRANIAYGMESDVPAADIEAAARAAHAHAFIAEFPDGYETVVGERGTRLSGGQRQRIAIARALLRNPPILILDEATSALDLESERLVQEAIDKLLEGRTVLVIAHRLSTIRRANQIIVLDGGRIVQRGRHDALLQEPGVYRRLYQLQFAGIDAPALQPASTGPSV